VLVLGVYATVPGDSLVTAGVSVCRYIVVEMSSR